MFILEAEGLLNFNEEEMTETVKKPKNMSLALFTALSTMADLGITKTLASQSSRQGTRELIILKRKFKKQD